MAIVNGTCVSFCNQPKTQFGYLTRVTPVCRCLSSPVLQVEAFGYLKRVHKAHFGLPWVRLWDNRGKCYMDGKRIQCWSNALQYVPIYLQSFTSYSEILVGNCNFFSTPLHLTPRCGCSHCNSVESLVLIKLESWGYQEVKTV